MKELIKKFTSAFSVSGSENELADMIEELLKPAADSVTRDAMGNLTVFKKGKDPSRKMMVAAHMDEIGFIATGYEKNGLVKCAPVGGINAVASSYTPVHFKNGAKGVIIIEDGTENADITNKKLFIDIGADSESRAKRRVYIGEPAACAASFIQLSANRISAKAFDDRIGCAIAAYAALNLKEFAYDTYFVFTVQEELGCRGAKPASFTVMPDYSVALDITPAPAVGNPKKLTVKLGEGAAIKIRDSSVICSTEMVERLAFLAETEGIKYQYEVLPAGGTDTSQMQIAGSGSKAVCISIPTRYTHTPVETIDLRDCAACEKLLESLLRYGV